MQGNIRYQLYFIGFFLFCSVAVQYSFGEETGNVDLLIKYENQNKASTDSMILKIYQDSNPISIKQIPIENNPTSIVGLPLNHKYKFELYYNDLFQSVDYLDLKKINNNFEMTIKLPGGIKFEVYYKDGTPLSKAEIYFKTMNGKVVGYDNTDFKGETIRFWLPQTIGNEYYELDVVIDPALKFTATPIKIQSSLSKDIKITTNWPKIIDSAISVSVYKDENTKITKQDGNFILQVNDKKKTKIAESPISYRGDAVISNILVGSYAFHIISEDTGEKIASKKVTLSGEHDPIKIYIDKPELNFDTIYCNCVAFRFDDVQDHYLDKSQIQMMKLFEELEAGLSIGVIGGSIGKDLLLIQEIKDQIQKNPRFEIASHSWNNRVMTSVSVEEQEEYIKNTDLKLTELFQIKSKLFIPPENIFDNETINILKKYNYDHLSASVDTETPPKFVKSDFYHFDQVPSTARLNPLTGYWNPISHDKIIEKINDSLFDYGYAVVMMHPYEFSNYVNGAYVNEVNQTKFTELNNLIVELKSKEYVLVPIGKIEKYNLEIIPKNITNVIVKEDKKIDCNCVAFKIDNIQDFWLNNVQNKLISIFSEQKLPVTVSIIGKFFGADLKVIDFFNQHTQNQKSEISVAIKGWEYIDHSVYGTEEQAASILQTNQQIKNVFKTDAKIFTPPFGKFNNNTLMALNQNDISYFSATITTDAPNFKSYPRHIPETSYLPNLIDDDPFFKGTITEKMIEKIQKQQEQYGYALISMQPSDFATRDGEFQNQINEERVKLLEELITNLKEKNIKIVSLSDIPQAALFEKYPTWLENLYIWNKKGQISDTELNNAIENLSVRGILISN